MTSLNTISLLVSLSSLFIFSTSVQAGDGVPVYVNAQCSGTIDSSIQLGDLSDASKGPGLMRDMFCGTYSSKPSGASYDMCSSSEQVDCSRTDSSQAGYTLIGVMYRQVTDNTRAECLQAYQYISDQCLSKGASTGTVAFGNGAYNYTMAVSGPTAQTPAQTIQCSSSAKPAGINDQLFWYMREAYCTAGGCSGRTTECEVFVASTGYRLELTGSIPKDQSDTQFSQVCYDATEGIINECWNKGKQGGSVNLANGESYGYFYTSGDVPEFEEIPIAV